GLQAHITYLASMTANVDQKVGRDAIERNTSGFEKWMPYNTNPLVFRSGVRPTWVADERFWYRITTPEGSEFLLVEAAKGTRAPVFDHAKLAAALSTATGTSYDAHHLPF